MKTDATTKKDCGVFKCWFRSPLTMPGHTDSINVPFDGINLLFPAKMVEVDSS